MFSVLFSNHPSSDSIKAHISSSHSSGHPLEGHCVWRSIVPDSLQPSPTLSRIQRVRDYRSTIFKYGPLNSSDKTSRLIFFFQIRSSSDESRLQQAAVHHRVDTQTTSSCVNLQICVCFYVKKRLSPDDRVSPKTWDSTSIRSSLTSRLWSPTEFRRIFWLQIEV